MANLHRIAWLDARIRGGQHPNAASLAREFEISARQARRDIEYLRYSLRAPLEYCAQENGYAHGARAYQNLLGALERRSWEGHGLSYSIAVYAAMKRNAAAWLQRIDGTGDDVRELLDVAKHLTETAEAWAAMGEIAVFAPPQGNVPPEAAPALLEHARTAFEAEGRAMDALEKALAL